MNHYIIPMMDWVGAGALSNTFSGDQLGQPVSFDRLLEAYQYGIQIARRDSDEELKTLAEQGKLSFNYGFYGTIRNQDRDLVALKWDGRLRLMVTSNRHLLQRADNCGSALALAARIPTATSDVHHRPRPGSAGPMRRVRGVLRSGRPGRG